MPSRRTILLPIIALLVAGAILFIGNDPFQGPTVVIYTSVDSVHAVDILQEFTNQTGIRFRMSSDIEANKTTGKYNQILAERDAPVADVFWNSEASRTEMLKREGLLEPYASPSGAGIPSVYRDPDGAWYGFGARARVIVVNRNHLPRGSRPRTLQDLTDRSLQGRVGIAHPLFGTTASHVAALFALQGEGAAEWLRALKKNDVRVVAGNSIVRDLVARGDLWAGLTDTDDVWVGMDKGYPIDMVIPDGGALQMGTLVIPNTVALIRGAPHPEEGRRFIDFLLNRHTEQMLAEGPSRQLPVRDNVPGPSGAVPLDGIRSMRITTAEIVDAFPRSEEFIRTEFLQDD